MTPVITGFAISKVEAIVVISKTGIFEVPPGAPDNNSDNFYLEVITPTVVAYNQSINYISNTFTSLGLLVQDVSGSPNSFQPLTWTTFATNKLAIHMEHGNTNNGEQIFVDAMGWRITYTGTCGLADDTLNPVPVSDTYDANELQFVSATPAINSSSTTGSGGTPYTNTGTLNWTNVGPLYAGGSKLITVTFRVLEPYSPTLSLDNRSTQITNTAYSYGAKYVSGKSANQVSDSVTSTVHPTGLLGDFVWRDFDGDGIGPNGNGLPGNDSEFGIPGVVVSLSAGVAYSVNGVNYAANTVVTTLTDMDGYYSFPGLRVDATYRISVSTGTLPSLGAGTFTNTYDLDNGTTAPNSAVVINSYNVNVSNTYTVADFGYQVPSLIAGIIWNDWNRSGLAPTNSTTRDAGEEYLSNVTVELRDSSNNIFTTTTDANGYYEFVGNYSGDYTVTVRNDLTALNSSWFQSYDASGGNNGRDTAHIINLTIALGESRTNQNYSYYQDDNGVIGDTVYNDLNNNGVYDAGAGEPGISGVRVWLYEDQNGDGVIDPSTDALVMTATTDIDGFYEFTNLGETTGSQTYMVVVDTSTLPGTDYAQTGDPEETGRCTVCDNSDKGITLTAGNSYTHDTADFGYRRTGTGSIGDLVFKDNNGDGNYSPVLGETGMATITVRLYISGVNVLTATSSLTGYYRFDGLPSGTYTVDVDTANPNMSLSPNNCGGCILSTNNDPLTVVLATAQNYVDADFGFAPPGAIGDTVYWDYDQDGEQDYTEPGIPGVDVILTNTSTFISGGVTYAPGQFVLNATTNASGTYSFTGLLPATYTVRVVQSGPLASAVQTGDPDNTQACSVAPTYCDNALTFPHKVITDTNFPNAGVLVNDGLPVRPGTYFMAADFGYRNTGVIGNFVFNDLDGDGVQDLGDAGIPGVVVTLTNVAGGAVVATTTTDINGFYVFSTTNVPDQNGTYTVTFGTPVVSTTAMVATTNLVSATTNGLGSVGQSTTVTLSSGVVNSIGGTTCSNCGLYVDAGFRLNGTGVIGGAVFFDNNAASTGPSGNTYDPANNDTPISRTTVYLWLGSKLVGVTETNASGYYTFMNLPDGIYTVSVGVITSSVPLTWTANPDDGQAGACTDLQQGLPPGCDNRAIVTLAGGGTVAQQDFGVYTNMDCDDLPDTYGTAFDAGKGACHVATGPTLGTTRSPEADARGFTGVEDSDDGVTFYPASWVGLSSVPITINVSGGTGYVVGWFDWNNDGDFEDANEEVVFGSTTGSVSYTLPVPGTFNPVNATLYARFRVYSGGTAPTTLSSASMANTGEVEGYYLPFSPTAVELTAFDATAVDRWWLVGIGAALLLGLALIVLARRQLQRHAH